MDLPSISTAGVRRAVAVSIQLGFFVLYVVLVTTSYGAVNLPRIVLSIPTLYSPKLGEVDVE